MEALGAIPEGLWSSHGGMYFPDEADLTTQLLGKCTFPTLEIECNSFLIDQPGPSWPSHGSSLYDLAVKSSSASFSPGMSDPYLNIYESGAEFLLSHSSDRESYYFNDYGSVQTTNQIPSTMNMDFADTPKETSSRKRSRGSEDIDETARIGKLKVSQGLDFSSNNDEEQANINVARSSPSPSTCNSEDESNNGGIFACSSSSPKGSPSSKKRASRGSATDPQSLYARKRREKINERLRILQSLVPNGTKVDISTMLEEAVHYVKFLQLQIQMLSSDELWMYAPIAYNGMDIGLDKNSIARLRQF